MSSHIFGPVPSRRLGRSLGIDLVPFKVCSFDCIYCQLGRTTNKTTQRKEWLPIDEVLCGLEERLAAEPDYITLSGSGEPMLNSRIGEVVERIKGMTNIPLAVLTNGSMLSDEEARRQILGADLVIPSLDAGSEQAFQRVNRPHQDITLERLMDGLIALRSEFRGEYWLEVFLVAGITASDAEVARLAECVDRIKPDRVQLNTAIRPPAESFAAAVPRPRMMELAGKFSPPAQVIADFREVHKGTEFTAGRDNMLNLLRRRPCTLEDIAGGLGMHPNEVVKYIEELTAEGQLQQTRTEGRLHYQAMP